jgi:hypothetical protein
VSAGHERVERFVGQLHVLGLCRHEDRGSSIVVLECINHREFEEPLGT